MLIETNIIVKVHIIVIIEIIHYIRFNYTLHLF